MVTKTLSYTKTLPRANLIYPLIKQEERILIWKKACGIWKKKKIDPIKYLEKTRKEWDKIS